MSDFEISSIPKDRVCGWTVLIDGEPTQVGKLELRNPRVGVLTYGMRPEGYDGWAFAENGGGGSITIPYCKSPSGDLLVGAILEDRKNMGGKRWCAIGGFKDPGETPLEAAVREAFEEAGVDFTANMRRLEGQPGNFNRLFSVSDPEADQGVHAFAVEVPYTLLEPHLDGLGFRADVAPEQRKALLSKGDGHVRFVPWQEAAMRTADVLFSHGLLQLLAMNA